MKNPDDQPTRKPAWLIGGRDNNFLIYYESPQPGKFRFPSNFILFPRFTTKLHPRIAQYLPTFNINRALFFQRQYVIIIVMRSFFHPIKQPCTFQQELDGTNLSAVKLEKILSRRWSNRYTVKVMLPNSPSTH